MKSPQELKKLIQIHKEDLQTLKAQLKALPLKTVAQQVDESAAKVWACSDCLQCANCCKSISPIVEFDDIYKMAKHLQQEAGDFVKNYLEMDEDGDFVFKRQPCPMLDLSTNKCKVYEARPKACREYPHLDQINSKSRIELAFTNMEYCGVVYDSLNQLK